MTEQWQFQIRITLDDAHAALARHDPATPALQALTAVLVRHDASLKSQYDAFADYLAEAEREGVERYALYKWTKQTLDDPAKAAKHARSFALRVAGQEVYGAPVADALEADLRPLLEAGQITGLSRHDTNPANNLPIPPEHR